MITKYLAGHMDAPVMDAEENSASAIGHVVRQLNAISRSATFAFALSVGECIVKNLYHGDLNRFRSRDRNKEQTLRAIAAHPDMQMSSGMLYRSVATYELCERLGIRSWVHVSLSHVRLVLPLNSDDQSRLLEKVERNRWPVERLDQEVRALRRTEPPDRLRGGRKRASDLSQAMRLVDQTADRLTTLLELGDLAVSDCSIESRQAAAESLRRLANKSARLQQRLDGTLRGTDSVPSQPTATDQDDVDFDRRQRVALVSLAGADRQRDVDSIAALRVVTAHESHRWDADGVQREILRLSRHMSDLGRQVLAILRTPMRAVGQNRIEIQHLIRESRDILRRSRSLLARRDERDRLEVLAAELANITAWMKPGT